MSKFSNIIRPVNRIPRSPFSLNRQSRQAKDLAVWLPFGDSIADKSGRVRALIPSITANTVYGTAPNGSYLGTNAVGYNYTLSDVAGINSNVPLTISLWGLRMAVTTGVFVYVGDSGAWNDASYVDISSSNARAVSAASTTFAVATGTTTLTDNEWYLITAVWESTTSRKIYLNGRLEATDTVSLASGSPDTLIVGSAWGGVALLTGALSDIRVITRAYSDQEVWALYDPRTRFELYQQNSPIIYPSPQVGPPINYQDINTRISAKSKVSANASTIRIANSRISVHPTIRPNAGIVRGIRTKINARSIEKSFSTALRSMQARISTKTTIAARLYATHNCSVRVGAKSSSRDLANLIRIMSTRINARSIPRGYQLAVVEVPAGRLFKVPAELRLFKVPAK